MKISIGANIFKSPWGGGNKFALNLLNFLESRGWQVCTDLKDRDIDIILITEPRKYSASGSYNQLNVASYLLKNPGCIIIHRINNCNESRKTKNLNSYLMRANRVADYTVFISNYLRNVFRNYKLFDDKNSRIIKNGADNRIFNLKYRRKWSGKETFKIVTHHWSSNYNKGFDIYELLDRLIESEIGNVKIEFTYIGNVQQNLEMKNTRVIPPLTEETLADKLKENHLYVTGAIGEGAGMHHIEAALCGLPLLFRNSGALPEYCGEFGVMFESTSDFKDKLTDMINNYEYYFNKIEQYSNTAENMCSEYEKLFLELLNARIKFNKSTRVLKYFFILIKEAFFYIIDYGLFKLKRY